MLARYGHQSFDSSRLMTHTARRAAVDAIMSLIDEENEAQRAALKERD